jgi:predicted DCC family thiol-disulfide oxidoreductase YuxK
LLLAVESKIVWELMDWGTVLLEAAFFPASLSLRAMRVVCAMAVPFHIGIHLTMEIFFLSSIVAYAAFIEWKRILAFQPTRWSIGRFVRRRRWLSWWHVLVGGLLLVLYYRAFGRPVAAVDTLVVSYMAALIGLVVSVVYLVGWITGRWERSSARTNPGAELDKLSSADRPLVLFDGTCGLCNRLVDFVLRRDPKGVFTYVPLQSPTGRSIVSRHELPTDDLTSIVLVRGARVDRYSTAVLEILRCLGGSWSLLSGLILVPPPLRDMAYEFVAVRRLRWFGRLDACRVPTPEEQRRFLT